MDELSEFVAKRGGENMNLQEFITFVSDTQFGDVRSPGYGMSTFYEPYDPAKPEAATKQDSKDRKFIADQEISKWLAKYNGEFKKPTIIMKVETLLEGDESGAQVDLLQSLQGGAGVSFRTNIQKPPGDNRRKIKKIHIYDKVMNPYSEFSKRVFAAEDGGFEQKRYEERRSEEAVQNKIEKGKGSKEPIKVEITDSNFFIGKDVIPFSSGKKKIGGKNVLRDFVGNVLPTITIGTNGTLIREATLASKVDGILGTINATGGSFRVKSGLTPSGLQAEQNLPMRMTPAQLSMTSLGCPLADLYQTYFIDFGTGTTIDNIYTLTQVVHTFSPGKFDTAWTFSYTDGYGKFFGAAKLSDFVKELQTTHEKSDKSSDENFDVYTPKKKEEPVNQALGGKKPPAAK